MQKQTDDESECPVHAYLCGAEPEEEHRNKKWKRIILCLIFEDTWTHTHVYATAWYQYLCTRVFSSTGTGFEYRCKQYRTGTGTGIEYIQISCPWFRCVCWCVLFLTWVFERLDRRSVPTRGGSGAGNRNAICTTGQLAKFSRVLRPPRFSWCETEKGQQTEHVYGLQWQHEATTRKVGNSGLQLVFRLSSTLTSKTLFYTHFQSKTTSWTDSFNYEAQATCKTEHLSSWLHADSISFQQQVCLRLFWVSFL